MMENWWIDIYLFLLDKNYKIDGMLFPSDVAQKGLNLNIFIAFQFKKNKQLNFRNMIFFSPVLLSH